MKIYTIYKATNLTNNKSYIGFDTNWSRRKWEHLRLVDDFIFQRAIRKYGKNAFDWTILYQSKERDYTLKIMEEHFIREYNSHKSENGYNMTWGGEGRSGGTTWLGRKHSPESIKKMQLIKLGKNIHLKLNKKCIYHI